MSNIPQNIPEGAIRYNTDSNKMEVWIGEKWMIVGTSSPNLDGGVRAVNNIGNFTPAINASFSSFYMKGEEMLLIMPSLTYEIKENLDSMLLGQFIFNNLNSKINSMGIGVFARISYNF